MRTRLFLCLIARLRVGTAFLGFILFFADGVSAQAALSGTRSVGPTGDYASLTAAIADVQSQTLVGSLTLELQPAYVSTVETFPLVFTNLTTTATNTLTIRPATGATGLSISSADTTAATVDLNGAQFVIIDGRPGGVGSNAGSGGGTASQLTIANTSTVGVVLRFINEASSNTIQYITLRGVNTGATGGTVVFSTTTGVNGNDNNTIDHCEIGDGASTPACGIYAVGSTGTAAQNNSGNVVSNCNIFNFYTASLPSPAGVKLLAGNTDWIIAGNSFYQTVSRAAALSAVNAIFISNTSGNNFTVTGNFIGGSAPNAGGTPWTTISVTAFNQFVGIQLNVGNATPSAVQNNTIANFVWTSSSALTSAPGVWSGIYVQAGSVNVGTVTGNTIGSGTGTGSVTVTTSGDNGTTFGICSDSSSTVSIANNTIGSITVNASASGPPFMLTYLPASIAGIKVSAGANTISNNTVGSTITANSLNAATPGTGGSTYYGQQVMGIVSSSATGATITGNTVANLSNNGIGGGSIFAAQLFGIGASSGVNSITTNVVRNLSMTNATGSNYPPSVIGLMTTSTTAGQTVLQNTVHSLASMVASTSTVVTGIYFSGPTGGTNVIARNFVHSLAVPSSSTSSQMYGMNFAAGTFIAQNNVVRVGLGADGASTAGASTVRGIYGSGSDAGRNFYHNSVYVGGVQTSGTSSTAAFHSIGSGNARSYQNNIFVNARSNSGSTSKHYAVIYGGTGVNPTGLTADGNIFLASGTGGVLGTYGGDRTTLAAWQAATGVDAASLNTDPLFIAPAGTASTANLHVSANSPAIIAGLPLPAVTDDFDGQIRSLTAPTIGADEIPAPNIAVTQLSALTDGTGGVDFGTVTLGGSSAALTFTITNPGTADLTNLAITSDGVNAGDFTVSALSGTIVPASGGSATFTVTFHPSILGSETAAIHIASNVSGAKNPFDITLTGTGLTMLQNWRQTFFGTTANTGNAADTADPYKTGVPNLATYAVLGPGQNPATVAAGLLPQPQIAGGSYAITFTQPAGVTGVTYGAQWSADLSSGVWTPIADSGSGTTHTFSVPVAGNAQLFLRLTVSEP